VRRFEDRLMSSYSLTQHKVITMEDIDAAVRAGAKSLLLRDGAILTPSAQEGMARHGLVVERATSQGSASVPVNDWERLFTTPEAEAIKNEICAVGRKLWMRQYVDGNGGNISYRLTDSAVICTPTLVSKADLRPEDLCLVDLEGKQLAGNRPRTSEILLHLEIYKNVAEAKAVVHCHPVHATAYAITNRIPPSCIIPEYEVFVGRVAISPYETPGTQKFAETVIPYVKTHNTVLLANHGIVCWADTVTHAEWYVEVVNTYCWTLTVAKELGAPISRIPGDKTADLIAIKQRLGLPDVRLAGGDSPICDLAEPGGITAVPQPPAQPGSSTISATDKEAIVAAVTEAVLAKLKSLGNP
jgi:L-fuculose-phosphate aldolase